MTLAEPGWWPRGTKLLDRPGPQRPHPPERQPRRSNTITLEDGRVVREHKATGLYWRPETDDSSVLGERKDYTTMLDAATEQDVLLDLGGHIGIVACMFSPVVRGVVTVEPDSDNLEMLHLNLNKLHAQNVLVVPGAVTLHGGDRELWLNQGKGKCAHSLTYRRGRVSTVIETYAFRYLLDTYAPTLLKVDIEGGEYELMPLLAHLPERIRMVAIELHFSQKDWREEFAPQIHRNFLWDGFHTVVEPDFETAWRGTTPVYAR